MSRFVLSWLRSRGLIVVIAACLVVALLGALTADVTLRLPYIRRSLPMPLVVVLVAALVIATPLQRRFGELEGSFARAAVDRAVAGLLTCALALIACAPASQSAAGAFPWALLLALMIVSVLAVVWLGSLAWFAPVLLGLASIYVDLTQNAVISTALEALGLPVLAAALVIALAVFVVRGPPVES